MGSKDVDHGFQGYWPIMGFRAVDHGFPGILTMGSVDIDHVGSRAVDHGLQGHGPWVLEPLIMVLGLC